MVTTSNPQKLRAMSDMELAEHMAGWKEQTGNHILCEIEFKRRLSSGNEMRGWISLGISVLALLVSVAALVVRASA